MGTVHLAGQFPRVELAFRVQRWRALHYRFIGSFKIEGTEDSDGVEVTSTALGRNFPQGLLVAQNGAAEDPADTSDVNGFE